MYSDNRQIALEEYMRFMDQKEPMITAKAFYEEGEVVGEYEEEKKSSLSMPCQGETLDEILRRVAAGGEQFQLIKNGSRKRSLKSFKVEYVRTALKAGYTYKEIGKNIGVSAEAVNKIIL